MRRLTIAIDCDDVLVPTAPMIINHYNAVYGTHVELKHFYSKDPGVWGVSDINTAIQRVDKYLRSDEYQNADPFAEAIESIRELGDHHELHMVTGRPDSLTAATTNMLERHFPDIFVSLEFTNFFGDKPRSKSSVCSEIGVDLLIDDHLHHATVVAECGIDVLLFGDYPWNQTSDPLPNNIQRVRDWPEVRRLLFSGGS